MNKIIELHQSIISNKTHYLKFIISKRLLVNQQNYLERKSKNNQNSRLIMNEQTNKINNASEKLRLIQQQKMQLKQKIIKLQSTNANKKHEELNNKSNINASNQNNHINNKQTQDNIQNQNYEETMALLLQKKKKLEYQKKQEDKLHKMQNQYIQRRKQMQREKQLQKIKNQKRLIELQVGMKRIVFDGVKQKVKGMNSQQLMARALLSNPGSDTKHAHLKTKQNIKNQFEAYLKNQQIKRQKQKYNVFELNNKRLEIFQKKQIIIMREVLLRQMMGRAQQIASNGEISEGEDFNSDVDDIDIMKMNKKQLEQMFQQYGLDLDDYMHPVPTQEIIQNYQEIKESTVERIKYNQNLMSKDRIKRQNDEKERQEIKKWVSAHEPQQNVDLIKNMLEQLIDDLVLGFQRRHMEGTVQEKQGRFRILQEEYQKILHQSQSFQISKYLVQNLSQILYMETLEEVAVQVQLLHSFAHEKTEECLKFLFNKQTFLPQIQQAFSIPIQLNFRHQAQQVNFTDNNFQKDQYLKKYDQSKQNIFQTQTLTTQLINDLNLLSGEEEYFQKIQTKFTDQTNIQIQGQFKIYFKREIFIITKDYIKSLTEDTKDVEFKRPVANICKVQRVNKNWVLQNKTQVMLGSTWNMEILPIEIGERINSPCGWISTCEIYPVFTMLGSVCSVLIGFQKGQILKYNFNMNRITSQQTNISHYSPLIPNVKTGDQAAFPLNNRNIIVYKNNKIKDNEQIHEFRQFFDHHTVEVIGVHFYRPNTFLSVDKNLKCAIWNYEPRLGVKSYQPFYMFEIRSMYKIFKQSQNPRFKDLYPSDGVTDTPQQMYVRWMQTESFLKNQIYNNPKKKLAYFKSPKWQEDKTEQPIWKISYDEDKRRIIKIYQSFNKVIEGRVQCKSSKIWKQYLILMVERDHVMRPDLKTIKIYCWNIEQKKLRSVGIQFDMYKDQKTADFAVIQNHLQNIELNLIAVISSGKIMVFSLTSGQLLRNLAEVQYLNNPKYSKYYFNNIIYTNSYFAASTSNGVMKIILDDKNTQADKLKFTRVIELAKKKYLNLV